MLRQVLRLQTFLVGNDLCGKSFALKGGVKLCALKLPF